MIHRDDRRVELIRADPDEYTLRKIRTVRCWGVAATHGGAVGRSSALPGVGSSVDVVHKRPGRAVACPVERRRSVSPGTWVRGVGSNVCLDLVSGNIQPVKDSEHTTMLVYRFATMFTIPHPGVQAAEALALAAADAEVGFPAVAVPAEVTAEVTAEFTAEVIVPVAPPVAPVTALPEPDALPEQAHSSRLSALLPIAGKLDVGSAPSQAELVEVPAEQQRLLPVAVAALVAALVAMAAALEVEGAAETATDEQTQPSLLTQLLLPTAGNEEVGRAPSQGPLLVPVTLLVPAMLPVPAVPLLQAPLLIPDPPTAAVLLGQLQE